MPEEAKTLSARKGGNPEQLIWGIILLCIWIIAFTTQIQTNEALIIPTQSVSLFSPNWAVLWQIPQLMFGGLDPQQAMAYFVGWMIEAFLVAASSSFQHLNDSFSRSHEWMRNAALFITVGLSALNGYTDFTYGSFITVNWMGHLLFAVLVSFTVAYAGPVGFKMVRNGWRAA